MKNVYEVVRQKEVELARLREEVDALRVTIPLIEDDENWQAVHEKEARAGSLLPLSIEDSPRLGRRKSVQWKLKAEVVGQDK
jgi:hypothetical protein